MDKFHYLNVPRIDIITTYDDFEYILKFLDRPLCVSVNFAAEERKWCALFSSNKLDDSDKLKESKSSHRYSFPNLSLKVFQMLVLAIDVRNSHYLRGIKGNYQEPRKINFH